MQDLSDSWPASSPWQVVHTKPRAEARALENLQRQGFEVFLPMITLQKVRRAKLANITEPMFSRYLFLCTSAVMEDLSVVVVVVVVSASASLFCYPLLSGPPVWLKK
jgi:hypothetical protein